MTSEVIGMRLERTGWIAPTVIGYAFIVFQAVVVGAFAELQYVGLRRTEPLAA